MNTRSLTARLSHPQSSKNRGYFLALGGILLISTDSLIAKAANADGWSVAFWYGILTAPAMLSYYLVAQRSSESKSAPKATGGLWLVVSGALQMVSTTAFILAVKATAVANVVAIIAALPIVAALVAWLLLGERTDRKTWFGIVGVMLGVAIIVSGSLAGSGIAGDLLALVAITAFALNLSLWRKFPGMNRVLVIALGGVITAVAASTQAQITGHSATTYLLLVLMGLLLGPVGRVWLATSTKYLTAAEVGLFAPIETVAASLWAWLAFSEVPSMATVTGGSVIIAVVVLTTLVGSRSST